MHKAVSPYSLRLSNLVSRSYVVFFAAEQIIYSKIWVSATLFVGSVTADGHNEASRNAVQHYLKATTQWVKTHLNLCSC